MLLAAALTPPEQQKHKGISSCKKLLNANDPNMPPCVTPLWVKVRSETTRKFKAKHKHSSRLWASLHVPWTTPGASQVFQAAGSERQASALQIHHLSLPLLPSGKSVSTTAEEGEVEETVGLVGRGVIRHYCLSPMPAGQNALALPVQHWIEGQRWVLR